jgi:transcriptional regulator with GAF, ATPase, and Fis domain
MRELDPFKYLPEPQRLIALEALYRMVCLINAPLPLEKMADEALGAVIKFMGVDAGVFYKVDEKGYVIPIAHRNLTREVCDDLALRPVRVGECLCGSIASTREEIVIPAKASRDPRVNRQSVRNEGMEFYAGVPILSGERTVGVLCAISHVEYCPGPPALAVLRQITGPLAIAMENHALLARLETEKTSLEKENVRLRQMAAAGAPPKPIIGSGKAMAETLKIIAQAAVVPSPVLIYGESGTGKELAAGHIHHLGPRKTGPFVAINCGAIAESVIESELFGHEKGAYTGADSMRRGYLEQAHGGTLFLDEIHLLSKAAQIKLLRALQEKTIFRMGAEKPVAVDFRIVASSNVPLDECVHQGSFRKDLYFRLDVIRVNMPPLRDRKEDIPALACHFAKTFAKSMGKNITRLDPKSALILAGYDWPGNVRELQNAMERAVVFAARETITPKDIQPFLRGGGHIVSVNALWTLEKVETDQIMRAMAAANGNRRHAAKALGVHPVTLWRKLCKLQSRPLQ